MRDPTLALFVLHVERIRASDLLLRSDVSRRLFDFLVERSLADKPPKEIEIAIDVFGKDASFAVVQSAMVRVSIHKLRRKLEEYYAGLGSDEDAHLVIPRGEYRLVFDDTVGAVSPITEIATEAEIDTEVSSAVVLGNAHKRFKITVSWMMIGLGVLVAANVAVWLVRTAAESPAMREVSAMRAGPIWSPMLDDNLPIYVVAGDYYIFGELDDTSMDIKRLVREFNINSHNDLEQFLKNNPQQAGRYMDVSLQYLPISVAYALQDVMPLLEPNNKSAHQVQVIQASDLTPSMIKSAHIIYIGLLSGMGVLRDLVFASSQFKIGDSYDELVDRKTDKHYVSQAGAMVESRTKYHDYGYFSTIVTPNGNCIVIIAGTRDVAAMHTAEAVTHSQSLARLIKQTGVVANFEALYAVEAIDRTNLEGHLLLTGKLTPPNTLEGEAQNNMATHASSAGNSIHSLSSARQ